jgi:ankyrin repeat protein
MPICADAQTDLLNVARKEDHHQVQQLIASGANVNVQEERHGLTPLHVAASLGNLDIAQTLIINGSDVNARDKYGAIPLHMAADFLTTAGFFKQLSQDLSGHFLPIQI